MYIFVFVMLMFYSFKKNEWILYFTASLSDEFDFDCI